jgi:hypothetical protein
VATNYEDVTHDRVGIDDGGPCGNHVIGVRLGVGNPRQKLGRTADWAGCFRPHLGPLAGCRRGGCLNSVRGHTLRWMALTVAAIRDPLRPFDGSEAWASKMRR